ncbi:hypothetical protein C366_05594 [Cryptococcus neoformans Tu401-1]|nr:hypothetical protein C365_05532 [Cryptococcus neoformans var. grubii Bt85]OXG12779.1 hypothetical protein C366_05594 [Cryptococcus neoformans var. grubii Tu401-1]
MRYSLTSSPPVTNYPFSSSPLNPYTHPHSITSVCPSMPASSSSPPRSSPTPCLRQLPHPAPLFRSSPVSGKGKLSTRYQRPARKSLPSSLTAGPSDLGTRDTDLFSEGTTPLEGAMWRERFSRRIEERERRRNARDANLNRRRGIDGFGLRGVTLDEDEAERKAQEDDEEIFRRIVILQRKKANHAALVSEEQETGGSDPNLPEFWEEELKTMENEERELFGRLNQHVEDGPWNERSEIEEDIWAREAAEAEEVEREAEMARMMEEFERNVLSGMTNHHSQPSQKQQHLVAGDVDMDVDWNQLDSMDIE